MEAKIYNMSGKEVDKAQLPVEVFGVELNDNVVKQVLVAQQANSRQHTAHTKGRADVRGGGAKPWRQKGTGRARHGSSRSPIWRAGGVTFGPTVEKKFTKQVNKKVKKKALKMVLSQKAKNKDLIIIDDLLLAEVSTKKGSEFLRSLPGKGESCLVVYESGSDEKKSKNVKLSLRNIEKVGLVSDVALNTKDLLNFKWLVTPKSSIKKFEELYR